MAELTEADIIALGRSLKMEFPTGIMTKPQTKEIVGKLFPRYTDNTFNSLFLSTLFTKLRFSNSRNKGEIRKYEFAN